MRFDVNSDTMAALKMYHASVLERQPTMNDDELLVSLGELVRKEISADQLLVRIVDLMADALEADRATVYWLDRKTRELVSVAAHLPEMESIRVPLSQGVAGYVGRTSNVVNIPYCEDDVRFWKHVDDETGYQTRTILAGPLLDDANRVVGVVQFLNKRSGPFTADDETKLGMLAKQASLLLRQTTLSSRPAYVQSEAEDDSLDLGERFNLIVGSGEEMREVFRMVRKVAPTDATVLLRGESGTGKTLVARAVHHNSRRAQGAFVVVDCTTLPEGLMENELFGHEKGAYTGASARTIGKVEAAQKGTLFFDEVGDLPLLLQGKLLTLLQDRTYSRVGGTQQIQADIRILAATNRDLEALVRDGKFREDLYYRLRVIELGIPPLRERGREDVVSLINHFVDEAARRHQRQIQGVDADALKMLLSHPWPGNVRELQNCIEAAVIFADDSISTDQISIQSRLVGAFRGDGLPVDDRPTLAEMESRYITHVLDHTGGNRSEAARILGIGRNTLLRKINRSD